jgi:hypothetical protein
MLAPPRWREENGRTGIGKAAIHSRQRTSRWGTEATAAFATDSTLRGFVATDGRLRRRSSSARRREDGVHMDDHEARLNELAAVSLPADSDSATMAVAALGEEGPRCSRSYKAGPAPGQRASGPAVHSVLGLNRLSGLVRYQVAGAGRTCSGGAASIRHSRARDALRAGRRLRGVTVPESG